MSHDGWRAQAEIYAIDALDGEERAEFERHLSGGCTECETTIRETREMMFMLVDGLPPQKPNSALKYRILEVIDRERAVVVPRLRSSRRMDWRWVVTTSLGIAATFVIGFLLWENRELQSEVDLLTQETVDDRENIARRKQVYQYLEIPEVVTIPLRAAIPNSEATGRILWDPSALRPTGLILTFDLTMPQNSEGKAYMLWMLPEGQPPTFACQFEVDEFGNGQIEFDLPKLNGDGAGQFVVTLERPTGARPNAPGGPQYLSGTYPSSDRFQNASLRATAPQPNRESQLKEAQTADQLARTAPSNVG